MYCNHDVFQSKTVFSHVLLKMIEMLQNSWKHAVRDIKLISPLEDSSRSTVKMFKTLSNRGKTLFSMKNIFSEKCSFSNRVPFQTPQPMFNFAPRLKNDAKSRFSPFFDHLEDHKKHENLSKTEKNMFLYFQIFCKILYKNIFSFRLWKMMVKRKIYTHFSQKCVIKHFFPFSCLLLI